MRGTWCPYCSKFKSERAVGKIFEAIFGTAFPTQRLPCLRSTYGRPLELDGYSAMLKLAYEYQGEYHYHSENYYNTLPGRDFQSVVVRDAIKQVLCSTAGI
eukprot:1311104-Amphidinium_carterae.3